MSIFCMFLVGTMASSTLAGSVSTLSSTVASTSCYLISSNNNEGQSLQCQARRHQNFVPWQVHRQVLIVATLAYLPLVAAFLLMGPLCWRPLTFWGLNVVLTFQVGILYLQTLWQQESFPSKAFLLLLQCG